MTLLQIIKMWFEKDKRLKNIKPGSIWQLRDSSQYIDVVYMNKKKVFYKHCKHPTLTGCLSPQAFLDQYEARW